MYLSTLKIWNFRKYGVGADGAPGLEVHFQEGVNVLIGENDSGKTTIVAYDRLAKKIRSLVSEATDSQIHKLLA